MFKTEDSCLDSFGAMLFPNCLTIIYDSDSLIRKHIYFSGISKVSIKALAKKKAVDVSHSDVLVVKESAH